jgi:hypothetical protein
MDIAGPSQRTEGGSVLVGDGLRIRDGIRQFTNLAVVRFNRLHQNSICLSIVILPLFDGIVRIRCVEVGGRKP